MGHGPNQRSRDFHGLASWFVHVIVYHSFIGGRTERAGPAVSETWGLQTQPRLSPLSSMPCTRRVPPTETAPLSYLCSDASVSMKRATSSEPLRHPVPLPGHVILALTRRVTQASRTHDD